VVFNLHQNFGWKKLQTEKLTKEQFLKNYQYSGGKTFTDNDGIVTEIKPTKNVGIITGFEDLEVIDIDLKVFSTAKEKTDFWNEYLGYLRDNILDFDDKFVIYKTMNDGYHILYKSKRCDKNTKIAKLKGHTEAIIETRGKYGYVFIYENNKVSKKEYLDIDYISDNDTCKNKMLLAYFDEITKQDCGICSYCFSKKKANPIETTQSITKLLEKEALSSREIENKLNISSEATIFAIQLLL
jgi:hypothetical protein